jgi:hypothetical protein
MASDLQDLVDKWFDLVREQGALSVNFAKDWLDAVQGLTSNRRATLSFRVPKNLAVDSGDQNNPHISLPKVAQGNIAALVGFSDQAGNRIGGQRLVVVEDPPNSDKFKFSLNNIAPDNPPVGKYFGPVVNTTNSELIALVVIDVF